MTPKHGFKKNPVLYCDAPRQPASQAGPSRSRRLMSATERLPFCFRAAAAGSVYNLSDKGQWDQARPPEEPAQRCSMRSGAAATKLRRVTLRAMSAELSARLRKIANSIHTIINSCCIMCSRYFIPNPSFGHNIPGASNSIHEIPIGANLAEQRIRGNGGSPQEKTNNVLAALFQIKTGFFG